MIGRAVSALAAGERFVLRVLTQMDVQIGSGGGRVAAKVAQMAPQFQMDGVAVGAQHPAAAQHFAAVAARVLQLFFRRWIFANRMQLL